MQFNKTPMFIQPGKLIISFKNKWGIMLCDIVQHHNLFWRTVSYCKPVSNGI